MNTFVKKTTIHALLTMMAIGAVAFFGGQSGSKFAARADDPDPIATYVVTFDETHSFNTFSYYATDYEQMKLAATPIPSLNPKGITLNTRLQSTEGTFPVTRKDDTIGYEGSIGNAYQGQEIINIRYIMVEFTGTAPTLSVADNFPWKNQGALVSGDYVTGFLDEASPRWFNIYFPTDVDDTSVSKVVIGYDC